MTVKRKAYIIISWILVLVCMAFIFWMSGFNATESSGMSDSVIRKILAVFGEEFSSFVVRKAAHLLEFCILAIALFNAIYSTWSKKSTPIFAFGGTVFYAITDEIHQLFIEGRACRAFDVFVDSIGALIGIIFAVIILKTILKIRERGNGNGSIKTL